MWNQRNKHLHSNNVLNNFHSMDEIDDQIRAEFQKEIPPTVLPQYVPYFVDRDLEEVMALSNFHRRAWMHTVSQARTACTTRPKTRQPLITGYLTNPVTAPTESNAETHTSTGQPPSTILTTHLLGNTPSTRTIQQQPTITTFFHPRKKEPPSVQHNTDDELQSHTSSEATDTTPINKRQVQSPFPDKWKKQKKPKR